MVEIQRHNNSEVLNEYLKKVSFRFPVAEISSKTGYSKGSVSEILKGNRQLTDEFLKKFQEVFLKDNNTNNIEVNYLNAENSSIMFVPLVTQYAYAGYLGGFADEEFIENLPKIPFILDKEYKGDYLCFEVKGDSMECDNEESILEGSILLCRNVKQEYWSSKLHINKWDFVIVTKTEGILVKRIIKHDVEKGLLILHSLNDFYPDKEIRLKDIKQIFNIVEVQQKRKRR